MTTQVVPTWDTFLGFQVQRAWLCDCGRAYYWAKPAVWRLAGRWYRLRAILAGIRDRIIPSGDEYAYCMDAWRCMCGREWERDDDVDLLCCGDWVLVGEDEEATT